MGNPVDETRSVLRGPVAIMPRARGGLGRACALRPSRLGARFLGNDMNGEAAGTVGRAIADAGLKINRQASAAATATADGLGSEPMLERLPPDHFSPGLLAPVCDDAPTRAIPCSRAGRFARSNLTFIKGIRLGGGEAARPRAVAHWTGVSSGNDEIVPDYGFAQTERQLAGGSCAPMAKAVGV